MARHILETTNDPLNLIEQGAVKYDAGKSPLYRGCLGYFPRALRAVADVSQFGASKYAWNGWEHVPDGFLRYTDGLARHLSYEGEGQEIDPDSQLLHAQHVAWNALARLELLLKERDAVHQTS